MTRLADERERRWREARARGEPTLPLASELEGLSGDEQAVLISSAAARCAAWWAGERPEVAPVAQITRQRRALLAHRVRAEVLPEPEPPAPRVAHHPCPWCGRTSLPYGPACAEHDELEREFLQAAGDGWG